MAVGLGARRLLQRGSHFTQPGPLPHCPLHHSGKGSTEGRGVWGGWWGGGGGRRCCGVEQGKLLRDGTTDLLSFDTSFTVNLYPPPLPRLSVYLCLSLCLSARPVSLSPYLTTKNCGGAVFPIFMPPLPPPPSFVGIRLSLSLLLGCKELKSRNLFSLCTPGIYNVIVYMP